jgi:serine/threonine protein kinase
MATQVLAERYELGERLGVGGMSTVLHAFDRRLERPVAVKLLAEHLADDRQFVARFRREALSAARLVHPNVVQVFDFGLDDASGRHYIVMELISGQSGAEILREKGVLGVQEALPMIVQACRGLDYAHRNGVVHRDVKPGNLLRAEDGVLKLADFGIAKALSDESAITQVGSVIGTAAYLAPEQAAGEQVGPQADLYALGVVTYQFLSGRLPYEAQSLTELALKQQREVPPPLDELNPEVPAQLAVAVERALALDPRQRYASAEEMRAALHDGARGIAPTGGDATAATSMLSSRPPTAATRAGPAAPPPPPPRRLEPTAGPPVYEYDEPPVYGNRDERRTRSSGGSGGRILLLLLLAAVIAGVIAFAIGSSQGKSSQVKVTPITAESTEGIIDQMERLIDDNTR